jgi:DNA-binding PadR family transcriptional regulator
MYWTSGGSGGPQGPGFEGPPFVMQMRGFGPGGPEHHHHHRRRRRMRRGDVRAAILVLLAEQGRNGYQLMQEIEERSGGTWRPSPGSVYPALQLLADEGLVRSEARDGGNVFELSDAGRSYVDENRERLGEPWAQAEAGVPGGVRDLMRLAMQVGIAARQVTHAGNEAQVKQATDILTDARRALYRILAEE